eukprot:Tamp_31771.p1 GENE.Tamp_31771~~Tamp_31771.p1  ORF type:complete len:194 (+),score=37.12 Tamp_31771:81-662(+)
MLSDWGEPDVLDSISCCDYDPEAERYAIARRWSVSVVITGASQQQRAGGKHAVYYALSVIISLDSMNGGAPSLSGNRGLPGDGGGGGTGDGGGGDTQAQVSYFINRRFSRFVALHGQLMDELPTCVLPTLPQAPLWGLRAVQSSELVADRVLHLQTYLDLLLEREETKRAEALFEFLELNSCFQLLVRLTSEA